MKNKFNLPKKNTLLVIMLTLFVLASCKKGSDGLEVETPVEPKVYSPYISKVFEYRPAPGQFINEDGLGKPDGAQKLIGNINSLVSLGGFGGYIIFGFDHAVNNAEGNDIAIYGNPIGGNFDFSEAGIVMVSQDKNGNGIPDDEWFELAGSEYVEFTTIKNYEITYVNPKGYADVAWTDNQGQSGKIAINTFHKHNYYPEFDANQEKLTLKGTKLRSTWGQNGTIYVNKPFAWGYADSYSTGDDYANKGYNSFDISWAVNAQGAKVSLQNIHFVKVYTAQNEPGNTLLGEISTEIKGARDLHIEVK